MSEVRILLTFCLLSLISTAAFGQRRVSADVEVKNLEGKSVMTTTKSVYCSGNGRLVVSFHTPVEYILVTNAQGEASYYLPKSNEVIPENSGMNNSRDELLSMFLFGRFEDLGLGTYGYTVAQTTVDEDGNLIKTFKTKRPDLTPVVEVVYKDYLPIYACYKDKQGRELTKTYYSQYKAVGGMPFPHRTTTILYDKKDSTIVRTIYSNVQMDKDDEMFSFQIPSDATQVDVSRLRK